MFRDILPDPDFPIGLGGATGAIEGPGFASLSLSSDESIMKFRANSQKTERDAGSYHKWVIDINYNPMECNEFHTILTFLIHRQATLQSFYVGLPQYKNQDIPDATLSQTGARKDSTILVNGTGINAGAIFTAANHTKVYKVSRVETAAEYLTASDSPGAGKSRLHITPSVQKEIPGGTPITFTDVLFNVVQVGDTTGYSLGKDGLFTYNLKLEEAYAS